jgi:hypothetical protein
MCFSLLQTAPGHRRFLAQIRLSRR